MSFRSALVKYDRTMFEPRGVNGEPVWQRDTHIRDVLTNRLSERHAQLFALPSPQKGDAMSWDAPRDGAMLSWAAATTEQREAAADEVLGLLKDIEGLIRTLMGHSSDSSKILGDILSTSLYVGSTDNLFFVDGQLVAAHWGMTDIKNPDAPSVLPRLAEFVVVEPPLEPVPEPAEEEKPGGWRFEIPVWLVRLLSFVVGAALLGSLLWIFIVPNLPVGVLRIPTDPVDQKDMSFIEGEWEVVSGLVDERTKEPVTISYHFNSQGKGEIRTVLETRGVACSGAIQASFVEQRLDIKYLETMTCEDGSRYGLTEVRCLPQQDGPAHCTFYQQSGDNLDVLIQRKNFWS